MSAPTCKTMDPRVRRTRQLLHDALGRLLETKDFETISIQDITDAATLNRATFYDHYPEKTALLKCLVAVRFRKLLDARGVCFEGACGSALGAIALGVCDYLAGLPDLESTSQRTLDTYLESAVITVVRDLILEGLEKHFSAAVVPLEMTAATLAWAIYGGAKQWFDTPHRSPSEEAAAAIADLLKPILTVATEAPE